MDNMPIATSARKKSSSESGSEILFCAGGATPSGATVVRVASWSATRLSRSETSAEVKCRFEKVRSMHVWLSGLGF